MAEEEAEIIVSGKTIKECLWDLVDKYPDMEKVLFDGEGKLLLKWLIYVDERPALKESELAADIKEGSVIGIYPIVSGG